MQIRFEMYVTNLIPEFLAEVAKKLERSGNKELETVLFYREEDWELIPRQGELVYVVIQRDPRRGVGVGVDPLSLTP